MINKNKDSDAPGIILIATSDYYHLLLLAVSTHDYSYRYQ